MMVDYRPLVTPATPVDPFMTPSFKWGTVTQIAPAIRVKLDGDSGDTGGTPPTIESDLGIGDRVYTILVNGQLVVLGKYGGSSASNAYANLGVMNPIYSWNQITTPGIHPYLMHATNNPNGPSAFTQPGGSGYYYLQVFVYAGASITQFGIPYFAQDPLVWRNRYNGVWSAWVSTVPTVVADTIGGSVNSANWYRKSVSGALSCRGFRSFPGDPGNTQSYTWNFPVLFVGEVPHVTVVCDTTVPQNMSVSIGAPDLDSVIIRLNRSTDVGTGVYFNAVGRWK